MVEGAPVAAVTGRRLSRNNRQNCLQPEVLCLQPARQQRGLAVCDWEDSGPWPVGRPYQGDYGAAACHPARDRLEGKEDGSQAGEGQVVPPTQPRFFLTS